MRLIAHRGLFEGPNPELENHPDQITLATNKGFNAEIDLWWMDENWWLGHDEPTYKVDEDFITQPMLWLHCKNTDALMKLSMMTRRLHYFWHQKDAYTLTSYGVPWVFPGQKLFKTGICVLPEWYYELPKCRDFEVYGFCSDYIAEIREIVR